MIKICLMQNSGFFYLVKESLEQNQLIEIVPTPPADLVLFDDENDSFTDLLTMLTMYSQQKTVLFTDRYYDSDVLELLDAGVDSIFRKRSFKLNDTPELLYRIVVGEFFMPPNMTTKFLDKFVRLKHVEHDQFLHQIQGDNFKLTMTEANVASLMKAGHSNKEIASLLGLTIGSVKVHVSQIYSKVGTNKRPLAIEKLEEYGTLIEKS